MSLIELIEGRKIRKSTKSGSIDGSRRYYYAGTLADCTSAATTHLGSGWTGSDPFFTMTADEYEISQAGDRDDLWYVDFKYHANFWDSSAVTTVEASASVVLVDFWAPLEQETPASNAALTVNNPVDITANVFKGEAPVSLAVPVTEVVHKSTEPYTSSMDISSIFPNQGQRIDSAMTASQRTINGYYGKFTLPALTTVRAGITATPRNDTGLMEVTRRYVIDPAAHARQKLVMDDDGRPQYTGSGGSRRVKVQWVQPFGTSTDAV
jgi:hypothetical protein